MYVTHTVHVLPSASSQWTVTFVPTPYLLSQWPQLAEENGSDRHSDKGQGPKNTQLASDWCSKQLQMHKHLHKHSPPLRTPLPSASGKSIIRKNSTELQMKIWWSWKRRGVLWTLCVRVCASMCVIAYSPLGWSLYHHPLMALKLAKSNQIISLGFLKWTQAEHKDPTPCSHWRCHIWHTSQARQTITAPQTCVFPSHMFWFYL